MTADIDMLVEPSLIIVISGKRKSGKDFIALKLSEQIGNDQCNILHLSAPLKRQYADLHGLSYNDLLSSSQYKETYRKSMILWGENQRKKDKFFFCKLCVQEASRLVWIVADARRPVDIEYFKTNFHNCTVLVRIVASDKTRASRGWEFVAGVDDSNSECALDEGIRWDFELLNDGSEGLIKELDSYIQELRKKYNF